MIALLRKISQWADKADWHSWVFHGLVEIPVMAISMFGAVLLLWLNVHPVVVTGLITTIVFWTMREGEQTAHEKMAGIAPNWRDHILDIVFPLIVAAIMSILLF